MKGEIKEKLDKAEAKNKAKTDQVASLVRMLFTQKRERIVFTPEQRESLYERAMKSLNLTDETKKEFERCRDYCRDYKQKQEALKLLEDGGKKKGHGRNKLPASLPTPELVAKIENGKYVLHQPFNRQIKKMKQDGLPMAPATIDDWHQATCEMVAPFVRAAKEKSLFQFVACRRRKSVPDHQLREA